MEDKQTIHKYEVQKPDLNPTSLGEKEEAVRPVLQQLRLVVVGVGLERCLHGERMEVCKRILHR